MMKGIAAALLTVGCLNACTARHLTAHAPNALYDTTRQLLQNKPKAEDPQTEKPATPQAVDAERGRRSSTPVSGGTLQPPPALPEPRSTQSAATERSADSAPQQPMPSVLPPVPPPPRSSSALAGSDTAEPGGSRSQRGAAQPASLPAIGPPVPPSAPPPPALPQVDPVPALGGGNARPGSDDGTDTSSIPLAPLPDNPDQRGTQRGNAARATGAAEAPAAARRPRRRSAQAQAPSTAPRSRVTGLIAQAPDAANAGGRRGAGTATAPQQAGRSAAEAPGDLSWLADGPDSSAGQSSAPAPAPSPASSAATSGGGGDDSGDSNGSGSGGRSSGGTTPRATPITSSPNRAASGGSSSGESSAEEFFGPLGISIVAVLGGIALCVCCTVLCYCCDARRKRRKFPPPPLFVGGKESLPRTQSSLRSGNYALTPQSCRSMARAMSPALPSLTRGGATGRGGAKGAPLLDGSVRSSGAYHKLPSPPFLEARGKPNPLRSSLSPRHSVRSSAADFPVMGAPSPEMLGIHAPSRKQAPVSEVKRSADSDLGAPADSIKSSARGSIAGGHPLARVPSPYEESSLFANPTGEGIFYAPSGTLRTVATSASADLAAQAKTHLSVHKAEDVAIVGDDDKPPGTPATLVRTLSDASSTKGVEAMDLLERQLDWLAGQGGGTLFGKLDDKMCRRKGGQGIIAFASDATASDSAHAPPRYVLKLYSSPSAFDHEREAIFSSALQAAMPACHAVVDSVTAINEGPLAGSVLPPVIITERGEGLREYLKRMPDDMVTNLQILVQLAKKLQVMHTSGYAHRDLKPGNAIWLESQQEWSLVDFGCTARCGEEVGLSFSLLYAAPEVVAEFTAGRCTVLADTASDVFAFGIISFEVLTRTPYYPKGLSGSDVGEMLTGTRPLPHEGMISVAERKLGALKRPVVNMLNRDPDVRPSITHIVSRCERALQALKKQ